jgi:hypothetical protein
LKNRFKFFEGISSKAFLKIHPLFSKKQVTPFQMGKKE